MEKHNTDLVLKAYERQWEAYELRIRRLEGAVRSRDERIHRLLDEVENYKEILEESGPVVRPRFI